MSVLRNSKEASVEQSKQVVGMMEEVRGVGGGPGQAGLEEPQL